jgi:hypothetical protein
VSGDFSTSSSGFIDQSALAGTGVRLECPDPDITIEIEDSSSILCNRAVACWNFAPFEGKRTLRLVDEMEFRGRGWDGNPNDNCGLEPPRITRVARLRHVISVQSPDGCTCIREFLVVGRVTAGPNGESDFSISAFYDTSTLAVGGSSCVCDSAGSYALTAPDKGCPHFRHENGDPNYPGQVVIDIDLTPGEWKVSFNVELTLQASPDVAGSGTAPACRAELSPCNHDDFGDAPDGIIDEKDLRLIARSRNSQYGSCDYIFQFDIDQDTIVTEDEANAQMCDLMIDLNDDGFVDFFDYNIFDEGFELGNCIADLNADGFLDFFDYDLFYYVFENAPPCSDISGSVQCQL